jgi:nicotinate-nucleotide--dimethylbenzimidazole phosphoribosyltransferase
MSELREKLSTYLDGISGADETAYQKSEEYALGLLKIPMSLGKVEQIASKLSGITSKVKNDMPKKCIVIMSADNGIVDQGVSSASKSVTATMTECFSKMVTGVGVISRVSGVDLIVYDVGIEADIVNPSVINKKIRPSTSDFSLGPAMSEEECVKAILVGIEAVKDAIDKGYQVIGAGEMGIGNTSSSTCVTSVLTNTPVEVCVGKGTGMVSDDDYVRKVNILKKAIEVNSPNPHDIIDVVSKVGGFDIAAMIGLFLGAAYYRIPIVIDGYISSVAALCAYRLKREVYDFMFESHRTEEPGYSAIEKEMELEPMFYMNMRLGEGSGCPFTFFAIDCANSMMNYMYTFDDVMMDQTYVEKINEFQF